MITVAYDDYCAELDLLLPSLNISGTLKTLDVGLHLLHGSEFSEVQFRHFAAYRRRSVCCKASQATSIRFIRGIAGYDYSRGAIDLQGRAYDWVTSRLPLSIWCALYSDWVHSVAGGSNPELSLPTEEDQAWMDLLRREFSTPMARYYARDSRAILQNCDVRPPKLQYTNVQDHGQEQVRWIERLLLEHPPRGPFVCLAKMPSWHGTQTIESQNGTGGTFEW